MASSLPDVPCDVPELIRLLRTGDALHRCAAAQTLGTLGAVAQAAVPALLEALNDPGRDVTTEAIHWGPPVSHYHYVRESAARALLRISPESASPAVPVMLGMLHEASADEVSFWKQKVVFSTEEWKVVQEAALPALAKAIAIEADEEVRAEIGRVLAELQGAQE
jgi:HEAT repeat protein